MLSPQEIAAVLIFLVVAGAAYAVLALFDPYWSKVEGRVRDLRTKDLDLPPAVRASTREPASKWLVNIRNLVTSQTEADARLLNRLARAGFYTSTAMSRYLTARLLSTAVPLIAFVAAGWTCRLRMDVAILAGCVMGGVGSIMPGLWIDRIASHRRSQLRDALPDFLDLMIVCLEGGMSLQETLRRVGSELQLAHPVLASELTIVQRDIELGATIDQALKRFAQRCDYEGIRTLGTFIREAQRFGTNITEALRGHADTLRTKREQAAEEAAQKASVKILLPTMLLIFPAVFVVLVGPAAFQIYQAFGAE